MKKTLVILLALILVIGLMAGTVGAADTLCNIKANFVAYNPVGQAPRIPVDASGYAVINYVKGQETWNVSGEVWNCYPNEEYTLSVGISGTIVGNTELVAFITDEFGNASFCGEVAYVPSDINIARIYESDKYVHTAMAAHEGTTLLFRGVNRAKVKMEIVE